MRNNVQPAHEALERIALASEEFALSCKALKYRTEFVLQDWQAAEPLYRDFMKRTESFFNRCLFDESQPQDSIHYTELFFGIVQGFMIRFFIEYFNSGTDIKGDFVEIHRKLEILYHMMKDQAYWAREVVKLLKNTEV